MLDVLAAAPVFDPAAARPWVASRQGVLVPSADGLVWLVGRPLWPALARVATDPDRVAAALDELDGTSLEMLDPLERAGEIALSDVVAARWRPDLREPKAAGRYAAVLARAWLVSSTAPVDADPVLRTWAATFPADVAAQAAALSYDDALTALAGVRPA
jgi:hypothetical protein